jgi:hypothetical protein
MTHSAPHNVPGDRSLPNQFRSELAATIRATGVPTANSHPFAAGQVFFSPGCHFSYRVIGACCRLFDREQLPWPCCRLQWRGKEPSWRRIGRRFVVDLATKGHPTYSVEILGQGLSDPLVITLYSVTLPPALKEWWYLDRSSSPLAEPD